MTAPGLQKNDWLAIMFVMMVGAGIFFPVFYSEYAYTDELVGLAQFGKSGSSQSLIIYGRYITERLAEWLFGAATTIRDLSLIRIVSFAGWMLALPVWYRIIFTVAKKEGLPATLPFMATLFLVCAPPVGISIGWSACFELFLANTAGLVSGYWWYCAGGKSKWTSLYIAGAVITGLISLFTYQNGFGCFLLPFLLMVLANPGKWRRLTGGIVGYVVIAIIYYGLFKLSVIISHLPATGRTDLHLNLVNKLFFFFSRPFNSAFHFTVIFNEKSLPGFIVYALVLGAWIGWNLFSRQGQTLMERTLHLLAIMAIAGLTYLPSLVVQENYASNRTLLALDMAVLIAIATSLLTNTGNIRARAIVTITATTFIISAWYNFNYQFLRPVETEYAAVRQYVEEHYRPDMDTVCFVRPPENYFVSRFGITRSWDEFGVPSTFFAWTPEFLVRQIVFEKTHDRLLADKLVVRSWLSDSISTDSTCRGDLLINTRNIMTTR